MDNVYKEELDFNFALELAKVSYENKKYENSLEILMLGLKQAQKHNEQIWIDNFESEVKKGNGLHVGKFLTTLIYTILKIFNHLFYLIQLNF